MSKCTCVLFARTRGKKRFEHLRYYKIFKYLFIFVFSRFSSLFIVAKSPSLLCSAAGGGRSRCVFTSSPSPAATVARH